MGTTYSPDRARRGSALLTTLVLLTTLSVLTAAFASIGVRWTKQYTASMDDARAFELAEAGANEAALTLWLGTTGDLASRDTPIRHGQGLLWVEAEDIGPLRVRLRSTALVNRSRATVETVIQKEYDSVARYALFSEEPMVIGSNSIIDSFDPSKGHYDTQPLYKPEGTSNLMRNQWAIVASNSDVLYDSNAAVGGDSFSGPSSTTVHSNNFYISGALEPAEEEFVQEIPEVPALMSSGPKLLADESSEVITGTRGFDSLVIGKKADLVVKGPATIVTGSLETNQGCTLTFDATEGPIDFFVTGSVWFDPQAEVLSASPSARDILVYFMSTEDDDIRFASNALFTGAIFAPYARVTIESNWIIYGALGAKQIQLASNGRLHFDESLLRTPPDKPTSVERIWWGSGRLPDGLASGPRTDPFRQLGIADPDELPDLGTAIEEAVTAAAF